MFEQRQTELLMALPPILRQIEELAVICDLEQPHFAEAWVKTQQVLDEQYPYICGEYGLQRWEKMLGLVPSVDAELNKRRRAVLLMLNEQLPFTLARLRELLARVAPNGGYEVELLPEEYLLRLRLDLAEKDYLRVLRQVLERTLPANMLLDLVLLFNSYGKLAAYTHGQLAARQHKTIREEVME